MYLHYLVDHLITDTYGSLPLFLPELTLCATIVVMLLVRLFPGGDRLHPTWLALAGSGVGLWFALSGLTEVGETGPREIFTGMLVYDSLTAYLRVLLLGFAVMFVVLSRMTGLADKLDGQDFYTLVLGATLGMCLMASANHLMTVFLSVEMASVPSYVLAGIVKGRQRAGEAALKYAVYGAGAAGVMLYGISLLAGLTGSAHLPTVALKLVEMDIASMVTARDSQIMVLALSGLMITVGLAFKLSAVPFHFWCPDVFEGATAEVDAFLSVASKAAALALLVRVALGVTAIGEADLSSLEVSAGAVQATPVAQIVPETDDAVVPIDTEADEARSPIRTFVVMLLAIVAAVTCTFGNLAAYGQANIKRMLAYSTIAHAGYMIMPVAAAVQLGDSDPAAARAAVSALLLYAGAYVFMNLGAFAIVAFLRNSMGSEDIADYSGLIRSTPLTAVALTLILVSLIGLPPLAGFVAKFAAFLAIVDAGGPVMITLLVVAGLNTAISLVYYLRVAKTVCIDPEPETRGPVAVGILPAAYVLLVTLPVVIWGIAPEALATWARQAGSHLLL